MEKIANEIIQNDCHNINTINSTSNGNSDINSNINNNNNRINTNTAVTTNTIMMKTLNESENEKSEKENLVQSVTTLRANFKKSNTCGSLYVRCGCSEQNSLDTTPSGANGNSNSSPSSKQPGLAVNNSQQPPPRRIKLLHTYSHPDTTTVFTDENRYADKIENTSRLRDKIISTKSGNFEISKRMSTPNIGNYTVLDVAIHPEIVLKLAQKHPNLSQISTSRPFRPILKKSSKSFPGLASRNSDYTYDSIINQTFSSPNSFEEETEIEVDAQITEELEDLRLQAPLTPVSVFTPATPPSPKVLPSPAQLAPIPSPSAAPFASPLLDRTGSALLTNGINSLCENSVTCSEINGNSSVIFKKPILPQVETPANSLLKNFNTAEQFFKDSGILGPMGNGVSSLLRRTSKIVPINDPHVKEQVSRDRFSDP